MSVGRSEHKVFLYKNDYNTMCTEVYRHQHIETGGNLFGLWTTSGNAVVQVVVGPGKECKRTDVSFNQDIEYMKHVGEFLNEKFMLCHIGEWHSYHHLTLNKPSDGDRRTVRNNFPQGMKKFLVIFANIEGTDRIVLSPYFFTDNGHTCLKAEFQVLDADSPFTSDLSRRTIARELHIGSENQQSEPMDTARPPKNNNQTTSRDGSRRSAVTRQSSGGNSSPASANDSGRADAGAVKTGRGGASGRNSSTTPQGETPDADPSKQQNGRNPSLDQRMEPGTSRHTCLKAEFKVLDGDSPFTMNPTIARELDTGSENQQSQSEPAEPMDTTPTNNHQPARQSSGGNSSPASADDSRKAVSDYAGAVKTGRGGASGRNSSTIPQGKTPDADPSKQQNGRRMEPGVNVSAPPSVSQKPSLPTRRNENENQTRRDITIKKIYDWIRSNLRPQDIGMEGNPSGDIEMKFKHKSKSWLITFPKIFPEGPAKMHCCRYNGIPKPSDKCHTHKPNSLNNYIDILLSIKRNCSFDCSDCKKMTVESVTRGDPSPSLFLTEQGNAMLKELKDSSIAEPGSFETQIKYDILLQDEAILEVSFKHSSKLWTVTLTSTFPVSLATMNYKHMRHGAKQLDSASKILLAISQECRCEKCKYFVLKGI